MFLPQTPMQRLVRRMTRFFVKTNAEDTMSQLIEVLEKAGYGLMKGSPGQVYDALSCSSIMLVCIKNYLKSNLTRTRLHPFQSNCTRQFSKKSYWYSITFIMCNRPIPELGCTSVAKIKIRKKKKYWSTDLNEHGVIVI